jgi:benzoate/toluate 1,2-dioxygenase beta subunit
MVTNVVIKSHEPGAICATAAFCVHRYDVRSEKTHVFFGRYHYRLVAAEGGWLIAEKHILLLNDNIPTVLDFYCV